MWRSSLLHPPPREELSGRTKIFTAYGLHTAIKSAATRESMDDDLRNRLWSAIDILVWRELSENRISHRSLNLLLDSIWVDFYKWPVDTRPVSKNARSKVRSQFFGAHWFEVLDFIEFVIMHVDYDLNDRLTNGCNRLFEEENAAYRILDDRVVEMTDETEIAAVEQALSTPIDPIIIHLKQAVSLLFDRQKPNHTNSVKESVLAVEACCQYLVGDSKATLGQAVKKVGGDKPIHPALKKGFSAIYGYTERL